MGSKLHTGIKKFTTISILHLEQSNVPVIKEVIELDRHLGRCIKFDQWKDILMMTQEKVKASNN